VHEWPQWSLSQLASRCDIVSKSWLVPVITQLAPDQWAVLRDIRLEALQDSPDSFLATYDGEKSFGERRWRAEFARGGWNVGFRGDQAVSLLGTTRERHSPADLCYLEYMWVAPHCRRSGVALRMLAVVLDRLRSSGIRTVLLWILDGNDVAVQLYKRVGFVGTDRRQPLPERPGRSEHEMRLELG
jgi:ribosomal protein S18 acetylase RimI-like enzyme